MSKTEDLQRDLEGRVAIVTGAASGIGRATALLLKARGALVVAEDVNPAVHELPRGDGRIVPFVGDVAQEETANRVVALAVERFGKLDILVNNAARIINKLVVDMSLDDWNSIMNVNVTGVFLHSREALRAMIPNRRGAIVNIGSYACFFGFPQIAAYAASKGALAQLTRVLALEAIDHGVRVNAVGSGDVVTNLLNDIRPDGREFLRDHGKGAPIRRAAAPEEIAEVVAFLASDKASFMVGSIVMADGGYSVAIQPGE
ncbi:SDR family oxidoreductase [Sorangium sp. So ce296]|uniref:SDR family NAD(P)-dependent oxidoreductase n=1 Tax=Sorangium sp. So ce296 TaxID=3133296 RepID=UPI003F600532